MLRIRTVGVWLVAATLLLAGCTGTTTVDPGPTTPPPQPQPAAQAHLPGEDAAVVDDTDTSAVALDSSSRFFASATAVLLAPSNDASAVLRASSIAVALGAPVLLTGAQDEAVSSELERLGAGTLIPVGDVDVEPFRTPDTNVQPAPEDLKGLSDLLGEHLQPSLAATDPPAEKPARHLARLEPGTVYAAAKDGGASGQKPQRTGHMPTLLHGEGVEGLHVLFGGEPYQTAAVANARAAGAQVALVPGDPRASATTVSDLGDAEAVVGYGTHYGSAKTFAGQVATAATGTQLPGGGQLVFDDKRYVALYGHPGTASLGVLGEQSTEETIDLAASKAAKYKDLTDDTVVPTLEVIVTVASGDAGSDGDYSREFPAEDYQDLIEAAAAAGQYVVLDFQPGRADFLDQVRRYEDLLKYPNVGIALDPEWRLKPDQQPLEQIGSVDVAEVNSVIDYVADFTREHHLPQKMVVLHQFRRQMIHDRGDLTTDRPEVALLIHADGNGTPEAKRETWNNVRRGAPESVHWGWKNFIDEDDPMLTPEQTYGIEPRPDYVSYQ